MPDVKPTTVSADDPQAYEDAHVHAVYDEIAPHFSSTRYKPWPIISVFLSSQPTGWVGVDLGTGNGKYLPLPSERPGSVWTVGLDRSINLLKLAKHAGDVEREVVLGDVLDIPWRREVFDYAISIATIHHLATPERRRVAVKRVLQSISPSHGRALIYVWAVEQDVLSKRNIPTSFGDHSQFEGQRSGEDVFVPWVLTSPTGAKPKTKSGRTGGQVAPMEDETMASNPPEAAAKVFDRYYHMFSRGELNQLVVEAAAEMGLVVGDVPDGRPDLRTIHGLKIFADGWERSNYYVELHRWKR